MVTRLGLLILSSLVTVAPLLPEGPDLRLWFAATDFSAPDGGHTLRETRSTDGVHWSEPSPPELTHAYAPTIIWDSDRYRMWYVHVGSASWAIKHADSADGRTWRVTDKPCMVVDQAWESHYTTSQSVLRLNDGTWRIWYATRKAPPHVNKYYAIGTAHWEGPGRAPAVADWSQRADELREQMTAVLTLPSQRISLAPRTHRTRTGHGYRIESITYAAEPGSRATALLYLPEPQVARVPAVIIACGHGGSKSCLYAQYAGQLKE